MSWLLHCHPDSVATVVKISNRNHITFQSLGTVSGRLRSQACIRLILVCCSLVRWVVLVGSGSLIITQFALSVGAVLCGAGCGRLL